jgi:hypothetical protein
MRFIKVAAVWSLGVIVYFGACIGFMFFLRETWLMHGIERSDAECLWRGLGAGVCILPILAFAIWGERSVSGILGVGQGPP